MKKRKNQKTAETVPNQNPVAKYAHLFNKAQIFSDKSKYSRKAKHTRQEASPTVLDRIVGLAACLNLTSNRNRLTLVCL
ncbi:MAG: hypothetical protein U1D70_01470 [Methylobacter sp.]|nr:hypothetical protein [Methylobacter sp.]MDP2430305.1 hypothetical protein [Methylobacter sp.]MDP3053474.1 hypothetical protein [Methylobacter sp.]MDP3362653.1 hypothetical protein [Methylobacter sp.]MDZ4217675.1 hypothetical protein [Methylobacter sp.]